MAERNNLFQTNTQSDEENRDEADRLLGMLEGHEDELTEKERKFVEGLADGRIVTPRMLFWLRDIKDRII